MKNCTYKNHVYFIVPSVSTVRDEWSLYDYVILIPHHMLGITNHSLQQRAVFSGAGVDWKKAKG